MSFSGLLKHIKVNADDRLTHYVVGLSLMRTPWSFVLHRIRAANLSLPCLQMCAKDTYSNAW